MIARTVKVVRGCRSQPYSESPSSFNTHPTPSLRDGASFSSAAPSSPQRSLADRMFLEGPATRMSTCELAAAEQLLLRSHPGRLIGCLSCRLGARPSAEPQQHQALHPEPEGDRQPAQTHAALTDVGMLASCMCSCWTTEAQVQTARRWRKRTWTLIYDHRETLCPCGL